MECLIENGPDTGFTRPGFPPSVSGCPAFVTRSAQMRANDRSGRSCSPS